MGTANPDGTAPGAARLTDRPLSGLRPPPRFSGPADRRITRALCIVAHPDDIEFFCGGTVCLLTRRGVAVDFVLATSGDKGTTDAKLDGATLAARREREQTVAARRLGAQRVAFLRHRDAELTDTLEFRGALVREIRQSRPQLLLTFDPTPGYRQHPDHRVVGRVALDACRAQELDPPSFPSARACQRLPSGQAPQGGSA